MAVRLPWRSKATRKDAPYGTPEDLAELLEAEGLGEVRVREPMSRHTTLKVGGEADVFLIPEGADSLKRLMSFARKLKAPVTPIGNGSNLLVRSGGLPGIAVSLKGLTGLEILNPEEGLLRVEAGVPMNRLIREGLAAGFEGVWYLTGIPGTVGGALYMNAGTRHGEIEQVVREVTWLSRGGRVTTSPREELDFSYRHLDLPKGAVIVEGLLALGVAEDIDALKAQRREVLDYRMATQPLQTPSCGSVFRNAPEGAAGRLIDEAGLKGVRVRGAQVSEQHANWIVNVGDATPEDILTLMQLVYDKVLEIHRVKLIPEVQVVGVSS